MSHFRCLFGGNCPAFDGFIFYPTSFLCGFPGFGPGKPVPHGGPLCSVSPLCFVYCRPFKLRAIEHQFHKLLVIPWGPCPVRGMPLLAVGYHPEIWETWE